MSPREDHHTHTEHDAGRWERGRTGPDYDTADLYDDEDNQDA